MTSILLHFLWIFSLAPVLISQLLCEKDYVVYTQQPMRSQDLGPIGGEKLNHAHKHLSENL